MTQSSTHSMFDDVAEFQKNILFEKPPRKPNLGTQQARIDGLKCLSEEFVEYVDALMAQDLVDAADALIDLIYFALGELYKMGLDANVIWRFVHTANMQKHRGFTKRGNEVDAAKPDDWADPKEQIREYIKTKY